MSKKLPEKTPLRKAVDKLIYLGKINKDEDLTEFSGLAKNTISTYINGKPGKKFLDQFEKHFNINISDFEESSKNYKEQSSKNNLTDHSESEANDGGDSDYISIRKLNDKEALYTIIEIQKKTITSLENQLEMMKEIISSNFQKVLTVQEDTVRVVQGGHVYLAQHFSDGNEKKFLEEKRKINKAIAAGLE